MAYTFTEVDTFTIDSTFDSLYADSLADLESGTVFFDSELTADEKKARMITVSYTHLTLPTTPYV